MLGRVYSRLHCTKHIFKRQIINYLAVTHKWSYMSTQTSLQGVSPDNKVVYVGSITSTVKAVKWFSLTSSAFGLALQPILLQQLLDKPLFVSIITLCGCGFFIAVTPLMLHVIVKRYVTRLEYDEKSRTFCAHSLTFFNGTKRTSFKASDVIVPDIPGLFTTIIARGKPLFLDTRLFTDADAYEHLFGFDKPLDLQLKNNDETT